MLNIKSFVSEMIKISGVLPSANKALAASTIGAASRGIDALSGNSDNTTTTGVGTGAISGAGALVGYQLAGKGLATVANNSLIDGSSVSPQTIQNSMGLSSAPISYNTKGNSATMSHNGTTSSINLPKGSSEAAIAHELGHVANRRNWGNLGTSLNNASKSIRRTTLLPTLAYSAGSEDPSYLPAVGHLAASAPNLIEEGAANLRAGKHLVKTYGLSKGLSKSLPLAPAMGTYALAGGAPLAVTAVRKYLKNKKNNTKKF